MKTDIRNINEQELEKLIKDFNQPAYRASQISDWIWKKSVISFALMKNIPSDFRQVLEEKYEFRAAKDEITEKSADGTQKILFRLFDGNNIEGVLIPHPERSTACLSTQVGCPLKCAFCATGQYGYIRNLNSSEIYDQFVLLNNLSVKENGRPLTNVVLMGMGEPFLNIQNVLKAMDIISSPGYLNFSPTRITFSTIGIPEEINKISEIKFPYNLAISLHSSIPETRKKIIPASARYSLDDLRKSLLKFSRKNLRPITVEYLLLKGVNTSVKEAESLVKYCSGFSSKVNLIVYNEVQGLPFFKPAESEVAQFLAYLKKKNFVATVRRSAGTDISAACGQLANKSKLVK